MSIISSKQPWSLVFADGSPITTLSMGSFGYANIASVVLPSGLHAIENGVFAGNHLQSAAIPSLQTPSPATQTFVLAGGLTTISFVYTTEEIDGSIKQPLSGATDNSTGGELAYTGLSIVYPMLFATVLIVTSAATRIRFYDVRTTW
jgi:hypothetical protein